MSWFGHDYNEAIAWTRKHRDRIIEDAANKNQKAQAVIDLHRLMVAVPEPTAAGLLVSAVGDYRKEVEGERNTP